jgi:hypothetical protein
MLAYILPSCPYFGLPLPFPSLEIKRAEEATFQYHAPTPFGYLYPCKVSKITLSDIFGKMLTKA